MLKIAYVSLLAAIAVSILAGWTLSLRARVPELPVWRRRLLLLGLAANGVSLALLLTVSFGPHLISNWLVDIYNYRLSLPVTVAPILLGAFGKRVPRVLVILNGLVLTFLWFNLAASSL
ncbi:MAG: hypothetical protein AUH88_07400 [Acidobacteria bacterium 13_1_40CM_4_61_5]|nr:MAG: hypothetical protein AUH88_07400 [Acidobacteria bacterium 13_1_40CM_4_61_5]